VQSRQYLGRSAAGGEEKEKEKEKEKERKKEGKKERRIERTPS